MTKRGLKCLGSLFSLFVLSACVPQDYSGELSTFCTFEEDSSDHCRLLVSSEQDLGFLFLRSSDVQMPFEEPIRLQATFTQPMSIVRSEIIGESMYMGRIPVVWEVTSSESQVWNTEIRLGACTDPHMVWALRIQVEPIKVNSAGDSARIWMHIPFQSNPR